MTNKIICQLCNEEVKSIKSLAIHINNKHPETNKEEYFINYMSINNEHICSTCGNLNTFKGFAKRFTKYCSNKCMTNSNITKNKRKTTVKEKYGVENISQFEDVKEKKKEVNIERHGVEHVLQSKSILEKMNNTIKEKFGVQNIMELDEFKNKQKETFHINFIQNDENANKLKTKRKKTIKHLYGKEYYSQTDEYKTKIQNTCMTRYGVKHQMYNKDINYKVFVKHKINMINKLSNSDRLKNKVIPSFHLNDYKGVDATYKYKFICTQCNTEFEDNLDDGRVPRCLKCYPYLTGTSKYETELKDFLKSVLPENTIIIQNDRSTISPLELDFYIPEHNLAIEFNGLYWHSEQQGKNKDYHINKTNMCKEKGIQLIHIFENEWIIKSDIVKSIIKNKLGLNSNKIYARKCEVQLLNNKDARNFLNNNHIQGFVYGIHYALHHNNELVSVLTMSKSRFNKNYNWEITRFCSKLNTNVIGGFSKLLKHFIINHSGSIVTYADLRYGTGNVYLKNGFEFLHTSKPNYFYTNDYFTLSSRNKFQKHKLNKILENYDSNLSEIQNMKLNNYDRIWDCGNNVYVLN